MRQALKLCQRVQIRQLGEVVGGESQHLEVGYGVCQCGLDRGDAVPGEEEGLEALGEGEVAELLDVVVGEVDCVLWLFF